MNVFTNFNAKAKKNTAAVIASGAKAIAAIIIAKKRFFRSRGLACAQSIIEKIKGSQKQEPFFMGERKKTKLTLKFWKIAYCINVSI